MYKTITNKRKLSPDESVFNRLYLINMLSNSVNDFVSTNHKTLRDAENAFPLMGNLVKKLTDTEVQLLITRIEAKL